MRKAAIAISILLVLLSSSPITESQDLVGDWKFLGQGPEANFYYRDEDIKKLPDEHVRAWVKEVPLKKVKYAYCLQLWMFDCSDERIRLLQVATYDKKKKVIDWIDFKDSPNDKWQVVAPGSMGEALVEFFCN